MAQDNRRRALSEVVALEAWHDDFTTKRRKVDLHVDVVFTEGRIGGRAGDVVRFRLRLKRADVVVVIPPSEPARVIKSSVSRDAPRSTVSAHETRKAKTSLAAGAKLTLGLSHKGPSGDGSAKGEAGLTRSRERALEIVESLDRLTVTQVQTREGDYAWRIVPSDGGHLDSRPWDAAKQPRLKIEDTRADPAKGIAPSVRVEVRCRREDLEIDDIALTDASALKAALALPFGRNRKIAAEALIRTRLFESGLATGDIGDPFAEMVLCATIAESQ